MVSAVVSMFLLYVPPSLESTVGSGGWVDPCWLHLYSVRCKNSPVRLRFSVSGRWAGARLIGHSKVRQGEEEPMVAETERAVERTAHHLSFDITGAPLRVALAVPFETPVFGHSKVHAWSVDEDGKRMVLYWTANGEDTGDKSVYPLPVPMELDQVASFVESWLATVDYGPAPDTDGSVAKSSRVYSQRWGRIEGHGWGSFVAIEPEWLVYGK